MTSAPLTNPAAPPKPDTMANGLTDRIAALVTIELDAITEPAARAQAAHYLLTNIEQAITTPAAVIRRNAIRELRLAGETWQAIGDLLGVTKQRAAQLAANGR